MEISTPFIFIVYVTLSIIYSTYVTPEDVADSVDFIIMGGDINEGLKYKNKGGIVPSITFVFYKSYILPTVLYILILYRIKILMEG